MPSADREINELVQAKRAAEKSDVLLRDEFQPWRPAVLGITSEAPFELLSDLARHFTKIAYCADMADAFGEDFWDGRDAVDYMGILTAPDDTDPREFAARCLNMILLFSPDDCYANYLLGTILRDQGSHEQAIKHFETATVLPGFARQAWWQAAVLLDGLGRDDEAMEAYRHATSDGHSPRGIETSQYADCLRRNGHIADAMDMYDRALQYDYSFLKELLHPERWNVDSERPPGLIIPWTPEPAHSEEPQLIRESDARVDAWFRRGAVIFRWRGRYFAVPRRVHRLNAIDLTYEALWRQGWRGLVDGFLEQFPIVYGVFGAVLHMVLPGASRRFLRRRIRSAATLEDLLTGTNLDGLTQTDGVVHDAWGVPYRIYRFRSRYFAVPAHMQEIDRSEISYVGSMLTGWRGYVERFIENTPLLYVLFHDTLKRRMPGVMRRFERRRIRSARTVDRLIGLITAPGR